MTISIAELLSALRNCGVCQDSTRGGSSPELFSSYLHESKLSTTLSLLTLILPLRKEEEDDSLGPVTQQAWAAVRTWAKELMLLQSVPSSVALVPTTL